MWRLAFIVFVLQVAAVQPRPVLAQKVPCTTVLRELHRAERFGALRGGDPGRIAKTLGTSADWVERCADVYGRRLQARAGGQRRAQRELAWESDEYEEVAAEEIETDGDVVVDPPRYRDKVRQREFTRRDEDWEPYTQDAWKPNTGKKWAPDVIDPHRAMPSDVDGLIDR